MNCRHKIKVQKIYQRKQIKKNKRISKLWIKSAPKILNKVHKVKEPPKCLQSATTSKRLVQSKINKKELDSSKHSLISLNNYKRTKKKVRLMKILCLNSQ